MTIQTAAITGCEPLIQLHEILLRAPGIYGARFSGAGFRGCCLAFVEADRADEAASFVREEYRKVQPKLASQISKGKEVLICEAGDCARVIWNAFLNHTSICSLISLQFVFYSFFACNLQYVFIGVICCIELLNILWFHTIKKIR